MENNASSLQELARQAMEQCRAALTLRYPALNGAFANLREAAWEQEALMATDGAVLFFQPRALVGLFARSPERLQHGYLHLLLHCLYLHILPPDGVDRPLWDLACDLFVERILLREEAQAPVLPPEARLLLERFDGEDDAPEALMKQLSALPETDRARLAEQLAFDDHQLWDPAPSDTLRQNWNKARTYAGQRKRAQRKPSDEAPGEQARSARLQIRRKNRSAYRNYLRRFAVPGEELETDEESFDYIYYTLGLRTYGDLPLVEPLEYREVWRLRELVIAIDTSGSCSEEVVARFLSEACAILTQRENFFRRMKVLIFQCDAQIQDMAVIHSIEQWERYIAHLQIRGRGSTDFCPVFDEIETMRQQGTLKKPCVLLYYTDGDGSYPSTPPDYETAFLISGDSARPDLVPPWARRFLL